MKTYTFKLYQHKRNKHLHRSINAAGNIYNHCIALHKRYYSVFGKHLNKNKLMKHIAKLRRKNEYWQLVGSQAGQDIVQRIDRGYQLFFKQNKKGVRPPNFRKRIKYKSFTLKQAGYKFLENNELKIGNKIYRYWKSREIQGKVKTVTIKRNPLGELFVFVVTDYVDYQITSMTGKSAGFDFGLKTFLTCCDDNNIDSPLFLHQSLKQLKLANRNLYGTAWVLNDSNTAKVVRGGSWYYGPSNCRVAIRYLNIPGYRVDPFGFRVVCVVFPALFYCQS